MELANAFPSSIEQASVARSSRRSRIYKPELDALRFFAFLGIFFYHKLGLTHFSNSHILALLVGLRMSLDYCVSLFFFPQRVSHHAAAGGGTEGDADDQHQGFLHPACSAHLAAILLLSRNLCSIWIRRYPIQDLCRSHAQHIPFLPETGLSQLTAGRPSAPPTVCFGASALRNSFMRFAPSL